MGDWSLGQSCAKVRQATLEQHPKEASVSGTCLGNLLPALIAINYARFNIKTKCRLLYRVYLGPARGHHDSMNTSVGPQLLNRSFLSEVCLQRVWSSRWVPGEPRKISREC